MTPEIRFRAALDALLWTYRRLRHLVGLARPASGGAVAAEARRLGPRFGLLGTELQRRPQGRPVRPRQGIRARPVIGWVEASHERAA